jgi:hypothetical protein
MAKLSRAHRALLEPYGEVFRRMNEKIFDMSDEDLQTLSEAVDAVDTSVWCMIYDAAKWLRMQIDDEFLRRKDKTNSALKTADRKQETTDGQT